MIGIVVSLPWELKSLTRRKTPVGSWRALSDHVLLALSGIGPERASAAASLLAARGATVLISWGSAAALDPGLGAGSLIIPQRIISADAEVYLVDRDLHARLHQALCSELSVHTGDLVESTGVARTPSQKQALGRRARAIATDMESAAQARLARERRLPFAAIRAIADTASTTIPKSVLEALDDGGSVRIGKLFIELARIPADWPKMIRLSVEFRAAQTALKKAAPYALRAAMA